MDATSAAFAVPLPVLVVNDHDGVQHRGTLQLPRRAPASPGRPPSSADLARLRPLMSALGDALAAQEEGLDPERLSRTYAALMAELQEAAGMGVHAVELTPATLAPVLPEGEEEDEEDEEAMRRAQRNWRSCQRGCGRWKRRCGSLRCGARDWLWCPCGWGSSRVWRRLRLAVWVIMRKTSCSSRCRRASGS